MALYYSFVNSSGISILVPSCAYILFFDAKDPKRTLQIRGTHDDSEWGNIDPATFHVLDETMQAQPESRKRLLTNLGLQV